MLVQTMVMRWKIVWKLFQAVSDNGFIFSFTLLLALKLDHLLSHSWWFVFTPLWWLCLAVISRGRCSLPTPPIPHHDKNLAPFQYVMATPLLVAFEILLFLHLEDKYDVDLKFVFLPLLAFEVAILVYNVRWNPQAISKCWLCNSATESRDHIFFECSFSAEVWRGTIRSLVRTNLPVQWPLLIHMLVAGLQDRTSTFLLRYCFQAVAYAIWHERNTRRVGGDAQNPARLITFLDKLIRNRISSLRRRVNSKHEKAMELWFGSR